MPVTSEAARIDLPAPLFRYRGASTLKIWSGCRIESGSCHSCASRCEPNPIFTTLIPTNACSNTGAEKQTGLADFGCRVLWRPGVARASHMGAERFPKAARSASVRTRICIRIGAKCCRSFSARSAKCAGQFGTRSRGVGSD